MGRLAHQKMLAIACGPPTMAAALDGLPLIRQQADCVELRLDLFREPFDLSRLLCERGELPVVVTLRPQAQGGKSRLPPAERLGVLRQAAELGAEYVDLEFDVCTRHALDTVRRAGARVIVSRHDLWAMPTEFADRWWGELAALDADVVKVVGTAQAVGDCMQVFRAFRGADRPTIGIAMGEAGLITRVLALREQQCFLTYGSLDTGIACAPGQLTVRDMRETYAVQRLGSSTRVYGLLGPQAEPALLADYNARFVGDGVDGVAVPFVADSDAAGIIDAFRELPVSGWHVRGPELQAGVRAALDDLAIGAARQNKVNAVLRGRDGVLVGHWVESPREQYELWRSYSAYC